MWPRVPATAYSPGTGARRYFTHDLVTNTLSGNTSTIVSRRADDTRTRVYFYIDENVPNRQLPDGEDSWTDYIL